MNSKTQSYIYVGLLLLMGGCTESVPYWDQDQDQVPAWEDCDDQNAEVGARYLDLDRDGHGTGRPDAGCSELDADGYAAVGDDCDDTDAQSYPGAEEVCDEKCEDPSQCPEGGIDNDCDGQIDEDFEQLVSYPDQDQDGFGQSHQSYESCQIPEGYVTNSADCDDSDSSVFPGASEIFGDGIDSNCDGSNDTIETFAGNGTCCFAGDDSGAVFAALGNPSALAMDDAGNLYFADDLANCVRKVSTDGVITTLIRNGESGTSGDSEDPLDAQLSGPSGLAVDGSGMLLYVADTLNNRIRQIDIDPETLEATSIIRIVGFEGGAEYNGDGLDGTETAIHEPMGLTIGADNGLIFADSQNHRIRKWYPGTGKVATIVGTGEQAYYGDGLNALEAALNTPTDVDTIITREGAHMFIADSGNNCIRGTDANNVIRTVAGDTASSPSEDGSPPRGYSGDGENSLKAKLNDPSALAFSSEEDGFLYFVDKGNGRIRRVETALSNPPGLITTVAGCGDDGYSGDGGPATEAQLSNPFDLLLNTEEDLLLSDTNNHRVRIVLW